jgi:hypothetical protein
MFEQLRKKKMVTEVQLMEADNTRELYQGYLKAVKQSKGKIEESKKDGESDKGRKKKIFIKYAVVVIGILVCSAALFKYRHLVLYLLKLVLNIQGN